MYLQSDMQHLILIMQFYASKYIIEHKSIIKVLYQIHVVYLSYK